MTTNQHTSLLKLQSIIKARLTESMPLPCWVTAEISELKLNSSGHCYLTLVEKGGANQVPRARALAVIWRNSYGLIAHYFRSSTGSDLAEGMRVLLKVTVNYHELHGLSLTVTDIDPAYTLGEMEMQRQQTIAKLQEEGVYQMNQLLTLPHVTQRIAVISSASAAGYQDFMEEIEASRFAISITLFDAFMQGAAAESSILEALGRIVDQIEEFDLVVIIRGGGSQSDLAVFDAYRLCNHIAQFPLPIITGIGHDKDESVADLVAHLSLKTPTAVAVYLVARLEELYEHLERLQSDLVAVAMGRVGREWTRLREVQHGVSKLSDRLTYRLEIDINRLEIDLRGRIARLIERERLHLEMMSRVIHSQEPKRILSMGFAIVRSGGVAVRDASTLRQGAKLDITLARGGAEVSVDSVVIDDKKIKNRK